MGSVVVVMGNVVVVSDVTQWPFFFFFLPLLLLYFERWRHQSCLQSPHIIRAGRRPSKSLREDRGVLFRFSSFAFVLGFLLLIFFSPQLPDKAATASLPSAPAGRAGVRASPLPPLERPKPRSCTRPPRSGSARCTACRWAPRCTSWSCWYSGWTWLWTDWSPAKQQVN